MQLRGSMCSWTFLLPTRWSRICHSDSRTPMGGSLCHARRCRPWWTRIFCAAVPPHVRPTWLQPLGRLSVIGGKHFNWLFTTGVARTLDTQTEGWLAQASNAELASEWVRLDLTEKPVTVVVPLVPKGGVNSERIEQHA
jgi:hypothetical protein